MNDRRILVIEDNPLNLELVTEILTAAGYVVVPAPTAEDGLRSAREDPPALILMDIRLPGMDGYQAIRALRSDARTQGIPTVALTAQAMKGDEAAVRDAGFDGYIAKPIDTRALPDHIAGFIRSRSAGP